MRYLLMAALALPGVAAAQEATGGAQGSPPQRIRSVTLSAGEECPPSTDGEVVVCTRVGNPYRIPPALRDGPEVPAANQSWVNRAATVDQVSRVSGGLPDTCSAVGTGGQSGCAQQASRAWAAERAARAREERIVPGGEED